MQVMPATAKQVANDLGIKYNKSRLSSDEIYNIRIGSYYFNQLLKKFKGSIVLSAAAYNAGPGTINRWLKNYGDPRKFGVDPLIWIEMIPYHETRNYVKRVLSNDLIYRHKISDNILKFDRARKILDISFNNFTISLIEFYFLSIYCVSIFFIKVY